MSDPIFEALEYILESFEIYHLSPNDFQDKLEQWGFMIVPIEDPTNLRYGDES